MKSVILGMFACVSLLVASSAFPAEDVMDLLKKNNCLGCHQIDAKKVGPPYMQVAAKYKGVPNAAAMLEDKVARGGKGVWGTMPMPANSPNVSASEIRVMVSFILSLAK